MNSWWISEKVIILRFLVTTLTRWTDFFRHQLVRLETVQETAARQFTAPDNTHAAVPPADWLQRANPTPPQHWLDRVRKEAPELLNPGQPGLVSSGWTSASGIAGTATAPMQRAFEPDNDPYIATTEQSGPFNGSRPLAVAPPTSRQLASQTTRPSEVQPPVSYRPLPATSRGKVTSTLTSASPPAKPQGTHSPSKTARPVISKRDYLTLTPANAYKPNSPDLPAGSDNHEPHGAPSTAPATQAPLPKPFIVTEAQRWPSLPERAAEQVETLDAVQRNVERRRRLDHEQQGLS